MPEVCQIPEHQDAIHQGACWKCGEVIRRAEAVAEFRKIREDWILERLRADGNGMQRREATADLTKIPRPILEAIPNQLLDGHLNVGFGVGGNTGVGKTQAIAAAIVHALVQYSERVIVPSIRRQAEDGKPFPRVRWSSWPDEVHWLRSHALRGAEDRVEYLAGADLLVLDDLGRERIKGDYSQDYGASHLDFIVNSRYRAELPIIWTSNVRQADLVGLYGAAMVRRLIEPNPFTWIEGLKPFHLSQRAS
ncbi:hypothetical protein [Geothrix sp. SG200]|uniref:hypothetical protein n=1 Tax=Geothrix sp. SG200 TaxID=2922865 RepID=UPI001FAD4BBB|nr:hypothetical protein [Geothrix sp. SG200]